MRARPAQEVADAIFDAVRDFRGDAVQNDDMTAVVVKITA
jgi:serine phosphatase RsbU (regulator of sigma subunit)